ncbi:MAG: M56 family metallopeptidase [Fimbriimonas sp.]|nr:M56 family metallopeptidase [Fimbriimonas sp.]
MISFWLETYLRSIVFGAAAFGLLTLLRRLSASNRHFLCLAALIFLAAVPLFMAESPRFDVPMLPSGSIAGLTTQEFQPKHLPDIVSTQVPLTRSESPVAIEVFSALWLIGVLVVLGRYAIGYTVVRRWVRDGQVVGRAENGSTIVLSECVAVPMTIWMGKSLILAPPVWADWDEQRKRSALAHEIAHIRRGDWFTQAVARVVCAILWPNPLSWLLFRMVRVLAEQASDDQVLSSDISPVRYARDLLQIAKDVDRSRDSIAVCSTNGTDISRRIELILDNKIDRRRVHPANAGLAVLALACLAAPASALRLTPKIGQETASSARSTVAEPTQIMISCVLLKLGVPLTSVSQIASKELSKGRAGAKSEMPGVYVLTDLEAKSLADKWKQDSNITSSPKVRTIDKQKASIEIGYDAANSLGLQLIPRVNSDRSITVTLRYERKNRGKESATTIVYRAKAGATVLLTTNTEPGNKPIVLGIVKTEFVNTDGP